MPLLEPQGRLNPELAELATLFDRTLGFTPNSVLTMQRRPEIARAFISLNRAVMANHGRVTSELKRLVAYLASLTAGCRYCQAHTALAAERFGASTERLEAIWDYASSPLYTEAERAALDLAVAASGIPNGVDEALAQRLRQHWDDGEIVELLAVVALFGYLNRWNDSVGTPIEEPAVDFADGILTARGWSPGKHGPGDGSGK